VEYVVIVFIVLAACFTQSLSGFGSALVAIPVLMPLLDTGPGVQRAVPLMVLVAGTLQLVLLFRLRASLNLRAVWRLALPSLLAVYPGMRLAALAPRRVVLTALGVLVTAYALYALARPKLPRLRSKWWAYLAGVLSGLLGGAYGTNGPPVIVYGSCVRWSPSEFKSNLQGFFTINNLMILASHWWDGNLTPQIFKYYGASLPSIALGILAAAMLEKKINPNLFRKIILCLLILLGLLLAARSLAGL
jgi:uncharacterized membrane protein YfcA